MWHSKLYGIDRNWPHASTHTQELKGFFPHEFLIYLFAVFVWRIGLQKKLATFDACWFMNNEVKHGETWKDVKQITQDCLQMQKNPWKDAARCRKQGRGWMSMNVNDAFSFKSWNNNNLSWKMVHHPVALGIRVSSKPHKSECAWM